MVKISRSNVSNVAICDFAIFSAVWYRVGPVSAMRAGTAAITAKRERPPWQRHGVRERFL